MLIGGGGSLPSWPGSEIGQGTTRIGVAEHPIDATTLSPYAGGRAATAIIARPAWFLDTSFANERPAATAKSFSLAG